MIFGKTKKSDDEAIYAPIEEEQPPVAEEAVDPFAQQDIINEFGNVEALNDYTGMEVDDEEDEVAREPIPMPAPAPKNEPAEDVPQNEPGSPFAAKKTSIKDFADAAVPFEDVENIPTDDIDSEDAAEETEPDEETTISAEEHQQLEERYNRLLADWDNYRRRSDEDMKSARVNANRNLIEVLLPTLDNFELALAAANSDGMDDNAKNLVNGFSAIRRALMDSLSREGLEAIRPKAGEAFDYTEHQAVGRITDSGQEPDTIVSVIQTGYRFKSAVLRPAQVTVSA